MSNVFFPIDSSKESLPLLIQLTNVFSLERHRSLLDSNFQQKFDLLTNDFDVDEVFSPRRSSTMTIRRNFSSISSEVRWSTFVHRQKTFVFLSKVKSMKSVVTTVEEEDEFDFSLKFSVDESFLSN